MYCSLEDAFPKNNPSNLTSQTSGKPSLVYASCWQADAQKAIETTATSCASTASSPINMNSQSQPIIVGAQCSAVPISVASSAAPNVPNVHNGTTAGHGTCMGILQHCLMCPACYRALQTHFQSQESQRDQDDDEEDQDEERELRKSRRRRRRSSRCRSATQTSQNSTMGANVLNEEVPLRDIHITWATLLIIMAGGIFILALLKLLRT